MSDKKKIEKVENPNRLLRVLTYLKCPKHGCQYPRGTECPLCLLERRDPKEEK